MVRVTLLKAQCCLRWKATLSHMTVGQKALQVEKCLPDQQVAQSSNTQVDGEGTVACVQVIKNTQEKTVECMTSSDKWSGSSAKPEANHAASQDQPPDSPPTPDIFLLAPFKNKMPANSAFFISDLPESPPDVFLLAPFSKKKEHGQAGLHCGQVRPTPLPQQPVAVHRVVSRVGQRAAVGSVAVGPLHSWSIGGRSLDDPFTAAPFQPKCSQHRP